MIKELIFPKWIYILKYINDHVKTSKSKISFDLRISWSHVMDVLKLMKDKSIISEKKNGRICVITLTKKGKELAKNIDNILSIY